jgi:hypothetical protein
VLTLPIATPIKNMIIAKIAATYAASLVINKPSVVVIFETP